MSSYIRVEANCVAQFGILAALVLTNVPCAVAANTGLPDVLSIDFSGDHLGALVTRWNIDTGIEKFSMPTGTRGFGDMARDANGRYLIYRGNFAASPALFQVNSHTGAVNLLVEFPSGAREIYALTGLPDGRLLGFDSLHRLVTINPATLAYQRIPLTPSSLILDSIAATRIGGIYAWMHSFDGMGGIASKLYTINLNSGVATEIGGLTGLPRNARLADIAFAPDGRLIGITEINSGALMANSVYEINLQTGIPTLLASVGNIVASMRGFEFVPEPSSLACLATSLLLLACIRKRTTPSSLPESFCRAQQKTPGEARG